MKSTRFWMRRMAVPLLLLVAQAPVSLLVASLLSRHCTPSVIATVISA